MVRLRHAVHVLPPRVVAREPQREVVGLGARVDEEDNAVVAQRPLPFI